VTKKASRYNEIPGQITGYIYFDRALVPSKKPSRGPAFGILPRPSPGDKTKALLLVELFGYWFPVADPGLYSCAMRIISGDAVYLVIPGRGKKRWYRTTLSLRWIKPVPNSHVRRIYGDVAAFRAGDRRTLFQVKAVHTEAQRDK
jgi:hypothetical protein